jgi:hypothetical protein
LVRLSIAKHLRDDNDLRCFVRKELDLMSLHRTATLLCAD